MSENTGIVCKSLSIESIYFFIYNFSFIFCLYFSEAILYHFSSQRNRLHGQKMNAGILNMHYRCMIRTFTSYRSTRWVSVCDCMRRLWCNSYTHTRKNKTTCEAGFSSLSLHLCVQCPPPPRLRHERSLNVWPFTTCGKSRSALISSFSRIGLGRRNTAAILA